MAPASSRQPEPGPPAGAPRRSRWLKALGGSAALAISVSVHLVLALAATSLAPHRLPPSDKIPIRIVEQPRPKPPPPPKPEPEPPKEPEPEVQKPEPPKPPPMPKKAKLKVRKKRPKPQPKPKPQPTPKPKPQPPEPQPSKPPSPMPPPGGFALDMEATVKGGAGVAVVTSDDGGNMFADPNDHSLSPGKPAGDGSGSGAGPPQGPLKAYEVDRLPVCPPLQPPYPPLARRLELEADVTLRLQISADGRVVEASIKRKGGDEFDQAALVAARRMRCKPATRDGAPVAVWIDYEIAFRLVD